MLCSSFLFWMCTAGVLERISVDFEGIGTTIGLPPTTIGTIFGNGVAVNIVVKPEPAHIVYTIVERESENRMSRSQSWSWSPRRGRSPHRSRWRTVRAQEFLKRPFKRPQRV